MCQGPAIVHAGLLTLNRTIDNTISYSSALLAVTCQNVRCEEGLFPRIDAVCQNAMPLVLTDELSPVWVGSSLSLNQLDSSLTTPRGQDVFFLHNQGQPKKKLALIS